jgi:3-oxoacyl-[acyl-carrier-protein] synthase-3
LLRVWIAGIANYVPRRVVDNAEIIDRHALKMRASWVERALGVRERRWADEGESASDLAASAVRGLGLDLARFEGSLVLSTVSPDYLTPSTASLAKRKLGLTSRHPAVDLNAACAGALFALDLAMNRLIATDEREALVVATEVRSRYLNPKDRRTVFLFGDGASAIHLRKDDEAPGHVEWVRSATIPSQESEILVPAGGSAMPLSQAVLDGDQQFITMLDGTKIVELTTGLLVGEIEDVLRQKKMASGDFDFFVFHQGNANISQKICSALGVPADKTWTNFDRFGNTSSASLGIALSEAVQLGRLRRGQRVLLVAMGAGYHVSVASLVWGR